MCGASGNDSRVRLGGHRSDCRITRVHTHTYHARTAWRGSTGAGYPAYQRDHTASCDPADAELALSADTAFLGDRSRLNPEQLIVLAASSCQLLSFLAVAARARIDVVSYDDEAHGEMPESERPMRITRIILRPRIVVAAPADQQRVRSLVDVAHRECFIANSLSTEISVEPAITIQADARSG